MSQWHPVVPQGHPAYPWSTRTMSKHNKISFGGFWSLLTSTPGMTSARSKPYPRSSEAVSQNCGTARTNWEKIRQVRMPSKAASFKSPHSKKTLSPSAQTCCHFKSWNSNQVKRSFNTLPGTSKPSRSWWPDNPMLCPRLSRRMPSKEGSESTPRLPLAYSSRPRCSFPVTDRPSARKSWDANAPLPIGLRDHPGDGSYLVGLQRSQTCQTCQTQQDICQKEWETPPGSRPGCRGKPA